MRSYLSFILVVLFLQTNSGQNSSLYHYVPRIDARDNQTGIEETGAGLLVGFERETVYIATAYHVVAGMTNVTVRFPDDATSYSAALIHSDRELDFAVLAFSAVLKAETLEMIVLKMEEDFSKGEPVFSIGHPFGESWRMNNRNTLLEVKSGLDNRLATITPEAIVPGCSGGPVFDLKEDLIGMVLQENEINAKCLKAYTIKKKLQDWRIPSNLILSNEEWWKTLAPVWQSIFIKMVPSSLDNERNNKSLIPPSVFFLRLFASTKFVCNRCELESLKPLSRLVKIQEISAKNNLISDITVLSRMRNLKYLYLQQNNVRSLDPLTKLYNLEEVNFKNNRILQNISSLNNLSGLQKVNLSRTDIHSITPLLTLNYLKKIEIFLTDVPRFELKLFKKQLPKAKLRFRDKREGLTQLAYLINRSTPKQEKNSIASADAGEHPDRTKFIIPVLQGPYDHSPTTRKDSYKEDLTGSEQIPKDTQDERVNPSPGVKQSEDAVSSDNTLPAPNLKPIGAATTTPPPTIPEVRHDAENSNPRQTMPTAEIVKPENYPAEQTEPPTDPKLNLSPASQENKTIPDFTVNRNISDETDNNLTPALPIASIENKLQSLLLNRMFIQTENQAFEYLGEDPENNLYRVYIVLGRLYQGQFEKARELWFICQNKHLLSGEKFTDKILKEIQLLEKQGVTGSQVKKFRTMALSIK